VVGAGSRATGGTAATITHDRQIATDPEVRRAS
jgi:hypothetical protein